MLRFAVIGVGLAAVAAMTGAASAADLSARTYAKAPPAIAQIYNWSGFYLGLNAGGAASHGCWNLTSVAALPIPGALAEGCNTATGALAGGQVGYRWQSASWVFGVEAQGDWANLKGSNVSPISAVPFNNFTRVDAVGLFTGQVGYAWNNALLYAKGGGAVTDNRYSSSFPIAIGGLAAGVPFNTASDARWGGTVGAGLEYGFAADWSVAVEYDHVFMSRPSVLFGGTVSRTDTISQDIDMGMARLNYHFGGPVVARY